MKKYIKYLSILLIVVATSCQSLGLASYTTTASLINQNLSNTFEAQISDIQSLDGFGNNLSQPSWGSVNQQYLRLSPADYGDGVDSPSGAERPSARTLSNEFSVNSDEDVLSRRDLTAFVYAWGQFLDHDINLTESASPREVLPIIVPTGDEWFDPSRTGEITIPVSRSSYDLSTGSSSNTPRQQLNSITAFIDGSQVYGVDAERAAALRAFSGGRLKISSNEFLPLNTDGFANANDAHRLPDEQLFLAGDVRANENPELLSLHILFVREHNRIADEVADQNPNWTDEQLYQYARRIVIAELQKITYDEFLPSILGPNAIPAYRGYDPQVNPGMATEFATAAFRFGHSMLGDDIEFLDNDGEEIREEIGLRDSFFNPQVLYETDIDAVLKYLAADNAQEIDTKVVDDVRNFLFGAPGQGGFDLAALNIQRGRDHGLADYNTVRVAYGLAPVTSFSQITSNRAAQSSLQAMYGNVDNIDLWVAGLAEDHLPNSSLGRTFTAILVDQFTRVRDGDRFWYENALPQNIIREINNTTLADIVRRNTSLTKLQADVFFFNEATVIIDSANNNQDEEPQPTTLEVDSTPQTNDQGRQDRPNRACPPRTPCPPPQRPGGPPPPPRRR